MPFLTLDEGHYRALEESLSALFDSIPGGTPVALVTAGQPQAERIRQVLLRERGTPLAGTDILPSIRHLAAKLSECPAPGLKPSPADTAAMAMKAMSRLEPGEPFSVMRENVSSAGSLGAFFERLLDQGITPEMYSVSTSTLM